MTSLDSRVDDIAANISSVFEELSMENKQLLESIATAHKLDMTGKILHIIIRDFAKSYEPSPTKQFFANTLEVLVKKLQSRSDGLTTPLSCKVSDNITVILMGVVPQHVRVKELSDQTLASGKEPFIIVVQNESKPCMKSIVVSF